MLAGNTYLVRGGESSLPELYRLLDGEGIAAIGNPDVYVRMYRQFGIDEARELSARAYGRALGGGRRVFIAVFPVITNEAQNALLKTLEEPPAGSLFFLVTPAPTTLLPTLRSRAQMLELDTRDEGIVSTKAFIKASPKERIEMLKPLLEKNDDDKRDIGNIITFLSSLERMLATMQNGQNVRGGIDAVYRARAYAGDKGSLLKPLLEQVALLVPVL
ncbi:MAG: hypothetical protein KBD06_02365 [Candidatus Pacebacteria bacterium]|nr:hypothetical protein [Candidatus Paceibacterota bacterium]